MKISLIQTDLKWEDKKANFSRFQDLLLPLKGKTDLVILPEMFSTGFSMSAEKLSEDPGGETFRWMSDMAGKGHFGICGSYIVRENEKYFNRFVFVGPDSSSYYYDKRHLFSMGGEDRCFSPGMNRLIFTYKDFRISPYVCYDLRFPVWSRNRNEYDLAIYCANWPEPRINVWDVLLRARAMENQCFVAGCNRIGTDGSGVNYTGLSQVINYKGENIGSLTVGREDVLTADMPLIELNEFRKKFNTLKDADDFDLRLDL
jgi:predicted amidohydrolase